LTTPKTVAGESEPGALADFLGGVKRFEDVVDRVGGHAVTGVADHHADEIARPAVGIELQVLRGDVHPAEFNGELSAPGHGVPGVDGQVDDHLFDETHIPAHEGKVVGRIITQLDMFPEQPVEHVG